MRLDSRLLDYTTVEMFTQELRLSSDYRRPVPVGLGGFYSDIERDYGQTLPTPGYDPCDLIRRAAQQPPARARRRTTPFFSRIPYDFEQMAALRGSQLDITERFNRDGRRRYYEFTEERVLYFGGLFADQRRPADRAEQRPRRVGRRRLARRACCSRTTSRDNVQLNAQASQGFRLGGINDPLNLAPVHAGGPGDLRRPADCSTSEELWNYELGTKIGFADGRGQFNIAAFHAEIDDLQCRCWQAPARRES